MPLDKQNVIVAFPSRQVKYEAFTEMGRPGPITYGQWTDTDLLFFAFWKEWAWEVVMVKLCRLPAKDHLQFLGTD